MPGTRTKKAPKDKNAPKKPLSAYFIYSNERRPILRESNKSLKITEIAKLIAAEWKILDENVKNGYQTRSIEQKKVYQTKFAEYKETENYQNYQKILSKFKSEQALTNSSKKKKSRKGRPKKPKKPETHPKMALSAYFIFQNDKRQELKRNGENLKTTEITKLVAKQWNLLTNDEKIPYNIRAKQQKDRFNNEMKEYKETNEYKKYIELDNEYKRKLKLWEMATDDDENNENNNNNNNNGEIIKLKLPKRPKDKNAPKKVGTAYLLFSNEKRRELIKEIKEKGEKVQMKEIQKKIGEMWKSLDQEMKNIFQERVNKMKQEYGIKNKEYQESENYQIYLKKIDEWKRVCDQRKKAHQMKINNHNNKKKIKKRSFNKTESDESSDDDDSSSDDDDSSSDDSSSDDSSSDESSD